ncbi:MAG TPA: flagellar biosynthetic protein FliR [bacterium]|nr:flagellar biosynthetic protein FliR [bacterium]
MALINVPLDAVQLYLLILMRITGLFMTLPVFGAGGINRLVKAGLIASFTLAVFTTMTHKPVELPNSGLGYLLWATSELMFGMVAGFLSRWVLEAVIIGAQLVGFQMGFAIANVVDPATGTSVSMIASFESQVALLVFLASGVYRLFLEAIAVSYQVAPLGVFTIQAGYSQSIVEVMGQALKMSITFAGAPIVALLITKLVLGIMARTVPQMNVFIVGFPLTIGVGFLALAAMTPYMVRQVEIGFGEGLRQMMAFIKAVGP